MHLFGSKMPIWSLRHYEPDAKALHLICDANLHQQLFTSSAVLVMQHDDCMASKAGVGFTDVGNGIPGTVSSQFDSATFQSWGAGFYERLSAHMSRASDSIGFVACHMLHTAWPSLPAMLNGFHWLCGCSCIQFYWSAARQARVHVKVQVSINWVCSHSHESSMHLSPVLFCCLCKLASHNVSHCSFWRYSPVCLRSVQGHLDFMHVGAQFMHFDVQCSPLLQVSMWQMWSTSFGGVLWKASMVWADQHRPQGKK